MWCAQKFRNTSSGIWKCDALKSKHTYIHANKNEARCLITTGFVFILSSHFFLFLALLLFNLSSSSLLFSSSVSSFLSSTFERDASRFSLRQVITVVVTKPSSEVTEVMIEPINAVTPILVFCDEGSPSGLPGEVVGTTVSGFCVTAGTCVVGCAGKSAISDKFTNSANTANVEIINKARNIFLAAFTLLPDHGFFLKVTIAKFFEQSLKVSR